ncbi:MAG: hypothetical protein JWR53_1223 [Glaciihabitans sp.]|nr:hypothetical protein [Glaciihabitans sp.]
MANWGVPLYSKSAVDRAAAVLVSPETNGTDRELALAVVNNWRSSHAFPLNTIQMGLRRRAASIDADATTAQRIKRLPSITGKIDRYPDMKLSRMQDIGGCRVIVSDVAAVRDLVAKYKTGNGKHTLDRLDDYIDEKPKNSGYRGVHLIYKYTSDRNDTYNGLRIEVQIRTRLQHAWATAVETVGFFTLQALKSSQGGDEWLRFFALMSSHIAEIEGTLLVPGTPGGRAERTAEILQLANTLGVIDKLTAYGQTLKFAEENIVGGRDNYFILRLDASDGNLTVYSFGNLTAATEAYDGMERAAATEENVDVVLVSVDSLASLRRAYPNYFLDTAIFVDLVRGAVG